MKPNLLFLLEPGFQYYGLSKLMQKTLPGKYYAIIYDRLGAKDFYKQQTDVNFENSWLLDESFEINPEKIDIDYLRSFENKYGISLWLIANSDKDFHHEYNTHHKFSRNEILSILENECKFYEKILIETKPDFLIMNSISRHYSYLLYQLAKSLKIQVLTLETPRLARRWFIASKINETDYKKTFETKSQRNPEDLLEEFKQLSFYKYGYEYLKPRKIHISEKIKSKIFKRNLNQHLTYLENYRRQKKILPQALGMRQNFLIKKRKKFINNFFENIISNNQKFLYFPLHAEPEKRTLLDAPFHFNQIHVIQSISKALPVDYFLYVKEHPFQESYGYRDLDFYNSIIELPNVRLYHPDVSNVDLIKKSSLVVTIAGTAGFEAAFYGKPSIVFSKTEYSNLSSVTLVENFNDLPNLIRDSLTISVDYSELNNYFEFLLERSVYFDNAKFGIDYNNLFYAGVSKFQNVEKSTVNSFLEKHESMLNQLAEAHVSIINNFLTQKST